QEGQRALRAMTNPMLDQLRSDVAARERRMRRIWNGTLAFSAAQMIIGAWAAARLANGFDVNLWLVVFCAICAALGIDSVIRSKARWKELRAEFERELERLEGKS